MGDRKVNLIAVLFGFCLFCSMLDITYAPSENWVEVARFTGGAAESYTTDYFICEHTLWRIRWEWAPNVYYMGDFGFFLNVTTYPEGESGDYIDKIDDSSIVEEVATGWYGGSHDIRDTPGRFYMKIIAGSRIVNYAVIVEQYVTSASEDPSAYTSVTNWSEVARFTDLGTENGTVQTDFFTTDRAEWRIRWEILPNTEPNDMSSNLHTDTYQKSDGDSDDPCIATFYDRTSSTPINGSSYFHYKNGTFYLDIYYNDLDSYTIIVEQDLNSIPEFPSWLILPLVLTITLFSIVVKRKMSKKRKG